MDDLLLLLLLELLHRDIFSLPGKFTTILCLIQDESICFILNIELYVHA